MEEMQDWVLDEVFGPNSKMQRPEWEKKVAGTTAKWLFNPKEVRSRVQKELEN